MLWSASEDCERSIPQTERSLEGQRKWRHGKHSRDEAPASLRNWEGSSASQAGASAGLVSGCSGANARRDGAYQRARSANGIAAGAATPPAWRPEPQPGASTSGSQAVCLRAGLQRPINESASPPRKPSPSIVIRHSGFVIFYVAHRPPTQHRGQPRMPLT